LLIAFLICSVLAAIFGQSDRCQPILDQIMKLSQCCSGKRG
jgi:hypothetical protein